MSGGTGCACPERKKKLPLRAWQIITYKANHSAFNGYHETYSDYSCIECRACGRVWRTKAAYVDDLPMRKPHVPQEPSHEA